MLYVFFVRFILNAERNIPPNVKKSKGFVIIVIKIMKY